MSTHIVGSSSSMNTLTSISKISPASYAHQRVLLRTNYLCMKNTATKKCLKQSFISQNHSKHMNISSIVWSVTYIKNRWAQRQLEKRSNRSYTGQFDSLWLASWADECMSLCSRRTVGGSAGSHAVPAEISPWVWIICYHGGDMGCGFCK